MPHKLQCLLLIVCLFFVAKQKYAAAVPLQANEQALSVRSAEEVITRWNQDQHLYVKGDLGVSAQQLGQLEKWLDENGPHWTVVLLRQADDENYETSDKRKFFGMDAVEFALGHGLANRTDFGGLINQKTGETDGAVFVLFLLERKFSYYGSDVHDRRELGESKWIGELDRDAIRAMKNGGRIIDAVKNTVTAIDTRLKAKFKGEELAKEEAKAAAERARMERRRELDNLHNKLEETQNELLKRIEESARQFRNAFPDASDSKLGKPPLDLWKTRLNNLNQDWSQIKVGTEDPYQQSKAFRQLKAATDEVRGEIDHYLDMYAAHKSFAEMLSPIEQRLDLIADHPSGVAIVSSDEAFRILADARLEHARGEVEFVDKIQLATQLIEGGELAIEQEQVRIKKEQERSKLVRRTLSIAASVLGAMLLGLLWLLNVRRRPSLRNAHQTFDRKSKAVEAELANVAPIIARTDQVFGNKNSFAEKKFSGQTFELGSRTLSNVQNLRDMSTEAQGVIDSVYQMLHPSNPLAEAVNMFSGARYEHCLNLLNGESLRLVPMAGEAVAAQTPGWLTFDQLFQEMRKCGERTSSMLDNAENGLNNVNGKIEELQARLSEGLEIEKELSNASRLDRYFRVPAFFEKLLPAVKTEYDQASKLAANDPVQAMTIPIPAGLQKIQEGISVANTIRKARLEVFPQLDAASDSLKELGFDIRWIEQRVLQFSDQADRLLADATEKSIAADADQFDQSVVQLGLRARRCAELGHDISVNVAPGLENLQKEISDTRRTLADKLNVAEPGVLHEVDYDPDVELEQARKQLQSARASLNYGGVESVMESLEVLEIDTARARHLMQTSEVAVQEFANDQQKCLGFQSELARQLPDVQSRISDIQSRYAESAISFHDLHFENESQVVAHSPESIISIKAKADGIVHLAIDLCQQAKELHFNGKVLQAANQLQLVDGDLTLAKSMLEKINEHCTGLDNQTLENQTEWPRRVEALKAVRLQVNEFRSQQPTLHMLEEFENESQQFQLGFENPKQSPDPFQDKNQLAILALQVEKLSAMVAADRSAFDVTSRSVDGAMAELAAAKKSVQHSLNDQIPDSAAIKQCQQKVAQLESQQKELSKRLKTAHENWDNVRQQADRITSELGVIDGQLRQELQLAQNALQEMEVASNKVFAAANWRGSYGIRMIANPGSEELYHSRKFLAEGEYQSSIEYSRSACFNAQRALEVAERQVSDARRAIARAAAEERRQRESSFSFGSSSSGISFGGGSSSSSWSSGSSSSFGGTSSSSSSSSGSGSGFSRSGW